jgi:hypothetical protein
MSDALTTPIRRAGAAETRQSLLARTRDAHRLQIEDARLFEGRTRNRPNAAAMASVSEARARRTRRADMWAVRGRIWIACR